MQIDPKPRCGGSLSFTVMLLLIIGADFAVGRPDVRESPFALELQPPLLQPDVTFSAAQGGGAGPKAIDSYGNPIDALRPIDTPDGRKVVSAQGVQFEIPTYASGITEIRRPADDLLPPHIGELTTTRAAAASGATTRTETETKTGNRTKNETKTNALTAPHTTNSSRSSTIASTNSTSTSTRTALAAPISTTNKLAKRDSLGGQFPIAPPSNRHAPPSFSLIKLNPFAGLDSPITQIGSHSSPSPSPSRCPSPSSTPRTSSLPLANANCSKYSTPNPNPLQPDAIAVGLEPSTDQKPNPIPIPNSFTGTASASAPAPLPATSLTPPHHDPSPDTTTTAEVEVEQAHLVPLPQEEKEDGSLPEYIRELQREDPNIGGPVSWKPAADGAPLSVIAWDLLPPHKEQDIHREEEQAQEPTIITEAQQQPAKKVQGIVDPISHNIRFSLSSGGALSPEPPQPQAQEHHQGDGPAQHGTNAHVGSTTPGNPSRFPNRQRGTAHYTTRSSSTTARPRTTTLSTTSTITTRAPTTTTRAPTTTTRAPTTTTRRTTTTRATTAKPETRTANPVSSTTEDPGTFYRLGDPESYAYTLPTWLQEVTDPDLDVAVTFEVPADNDQYNHTLASDLEPPFEPFIDLGNIQLTPPPTSRPTTTTTARAATTRTTTTTTTAAPTTTTTTTTRTTTTTPRTTTTTTRRPSTQRTTKAPIPTPPTHSTQAHHPEPPPVKLTTTTTHHHADTPPEDSSSSGSSSSGSFTTNTTPIPLDAGNPFDSATIPAWLRDFDYPDVGPGVPFDPDNFGPAASSTRSPTTLPRLPTFPTASSAFPSKVTLPLPGSSSSSSTGSSEEPPLVLIPPADRPDSVSGFASAADSNPGQLTYPTTNSITPFAARFEPPASSQNQIQPAGSSAEPFPPSKFEYTKSDEGKVISTPVANNQRKTETAAPASNTGKYTGGFGAPAGLLRPQSTNPSGPNSSGSSNTDIYVAGNKHEFSTIVKENKLRPTVNPGRYNGGFGAPTGVLSPQPQSTSQSQSQSQAEPRPFQPVHQQAEHRDRPSGGNRRTDSRFGGPPGILVPFDNVQRTGGQ